jgi:hypothetical protein
VYLEYLVVPEYLVFPEIPELPAGLEYLEVLVFPECPVALVYLEYPVDCKVNLPTGQRY